jgi:hypothetical protein
VHKIEFHVEEPLKKPPREILPLDVRPTPIEKFQAAEDTKWQVVSTLLRMLNLEEVVYDTRWDIIHMQKLLDSKVFPPKVEETNRYDKIDKHTSTEGGELSDDRADMQVQMHQEHLVLMHQVQVHPEHSV